MDDLTEIAKLRALAEELVEAPAADSDQRALAKGFLSLLNESREARSLLASAKFKLSEAAGFARNAEPQSELVQEYVGELNELRDDISAYLDR